MHLLYDDYRPLSIHYEKYYRVAFGIHC